MIKEWIQRLRARKRLAEDIALWYHSDYASPALARTARTANIEVQRAELALGELARDGLLRYGDIRPSPIASYRDLLRVHPDRYLETTSSPEVLGHIFGLDPDLLPVEELLRAQRRNVGGTMAAAEAVARGRRKIAFNLGGGLHHAEPEMGSGFCVYNDVAVAIASLRERGFTAPIAIIDLDYHQGNGNLVAFADDPSVLTCSIHGSVWTHVESERDVSVCLPSGAGDLAYLNALHERVLPAVRSFHPGLVFFLAGTDVLAGDRLGDFQLTPQGLLRRDRHVIQCAQRAHVPIVITMAGGYSRLSWQCTANLLRWLLTGDEEVAEHVETDLIHHFREVFRGIDPRELQRVEDEGLQLTEEEILDDLGPAPRTRLMFGYYTRQGIEFALERYGFLDRLRRLGFGDLHVEIDPSDPWHQIIRVRGRRVHPHSEPVLLVELVARLQEVPAPEALGLERPLRTLVIEWLLLQDPTSPFSLARPPLPGQDHPGLGLALEAQELLVQVCHRLDLDGILHRPAHFHVAAVVRSRYHFLDPAVQGRFEAMHAVLKDYDLTDATGRVDQGSLRLADDSVVRWEPADYLLPVNALLETYFASQAYRERAVTEHDRLLAAGLHLGRPARGPEERPGATRRFGPG